MIQIRKNQFETNSSSSHVFVISNNSNLQIPKEIKMSELRRHSEIELNDGTNKTIDKIAMLYNLALDYGKEIEFIDYLKNKGITIILDEEPIFDFDIFMFGEYIDEDDLDKILFSNSTKYYYNKSIDSKEKEKIRNNGGNVFDIRR